MGLRTFVQKRISLISITEIIAFVLVALTISAFVPYMIKRGTEGKKPEPINPFLASKIAEYKSKEGYEWSKWRSSVPYAAIALCGMVVLIRRTIRSRYLALAMTAYSALFLLYTIASGPRHDYWAYLDEWKVAFDGGDPWWIQPEMGVIWNAYGPLFLVFAPMAWMIHAYLPKILFSCSFLVLAVYVVRAFESETNPPKYRKWLLAGFLACPYFWNEIAYVGHFDIMIGVFLVAALADFDRGSQVKSGIMVSAGFLLKFIPAIVVPFLTVETRGRFRIHTRLAISFFAVSAGVMGLSWWIWGESAFRPITFASGRESTGLSIWRYLGGAYTPWALAGWPRTNLDPYAKYGLLAGLALVGLLHLIRKAHPVHSAFIAMMVTVNLYHVGYPAYHMVAIVIMPYWYWRFRDTIQYRMKLQASLILYVLWITAADIKGPPGDWIGPFSFAIGFYAIANLVEMMGAEEPAEIPERA